jgi:hypothetical protein
MSNNIQKKIKYHFLKAIWVRRARKWVSKQFRKWKNEINVFYELCKNFECHEREILFNSKQGQREKILLLFRWHNLLQLSCSFFFVIRQPATVHMLRESLQILNLILWHKESLKNYFNKKSQKNINKNFSKNLRDFNLIIGHDMTYASPPSLYKTALIKKFSIFLLQGVLTSSCAVFYFADGAIVPFRFL